LNHIEVLLDHIWSTVHMCSLHTIKRTRNGCIIVWQFLQDLEYSERLRRLGLWTLEERRNRVDLIEVYKILNAQSLNTVCTVDAGTRVHSPKLHKRHYNKDLW